SAWRPVSLFFQAEDGIRDRNVTGVQTCALPIFTVNAAVFEPPSEPLDPLEPSESPEPLDPSESPESLPGSYVTTNWKDPTLESSAWSPNATVTVFSPCSGVKTTEQVVDSPASSEAASQVTSPRSDSASSVLIGLSLLLVTGIVISICSPTPSGVSAAEMTSM